MPDAAQHLEQQALRLGERMAASAVPLALAEAHTQMGDDAQPNCEQAALIATLAKQPFALSRLHTDI